jgi:hypothetical protein
MLLMCRENIPAFFFYSSKLRVKCESVLPLSSPRDGDVIYYEAENTPLEVRREAKSGMIMALINHRRVVFAWCGFKWYFKLLMDICRRGSLGSAGNDDARISGYAYMKWVC